MQPMITNGGPHPADKWADMTTDTILGLIKVGEDSVTEEAAAARQAKRDLRPILFDIFMGHHDGVQKHERGHLPKNIKTAEKANAHAHALDVTPHMGVADEVFSALAATPFAAHFAKPEVQDVIRQIIGSHTADVMHIERRWHHNRLSAAAKGA
jgi:hypothetical protein